MLHVEGAELAIGGNSILRGAELHVPAGRLVAIVGPNGAGKSTLVRVAAGLQRPDAGTVLWDGVDIRKLSPRRLARMRAFVPQRGNVPSGVSVREVVELGRAPHIGPLSRPTRADREAVDRALERTRTSELQDRRLSTLSGGELQKVQIAIALAQEAPALMADEPTSSLDLGASSSIVRLLRRLAHEDRLTVIVVVHDLALAAAIADEVVVVSHGRTVASGAPGEVLTPERLAEVWNVDADIEHSDSGRTALHVNWLAAAPNGTQSAEDKPS
ncbi:MAG: ABC transporter ATP-binding protein [Baekduia sp.]